MSAVSCPPGPSPSQGTAPRRFLHLWLPRLPTDRARRERPGLPPDAALAVVGKARSALRLLAVDAAAEGTGLVPGLTLREARRRTPTLVTAPHDAAADAALVRRLLARCRRFTPSLTEAPDALTLDVTGAGALFGGEASLAAEARALVESHGVSVRAALADTPSLAWTLARFAPGAAPPGQGRAALAPLPVEALRRPGDAPDGLVEDLRGLGLRTVGEALDWPRARLSEALGAELWLRLDELLGSRPCALAVRLEPVRFSAERRLKAQVSGADAILHHVRRLAEPLGEQLLGRNRGGRGFELQLFGDDGVRTLSVRARRPLTDPVEIAALFARRLDRLGEDGAPPGRPLGDGPLEEGFDQLRLLARPTEPLAARTGDLLGENGEAALEAFAQSVEARFGPGLLQAAVLDRRSAKPEREARFAAWGPAGSASGGVAGGAAGMGDGPEPPPPAWGDAVLRPLRLFHPPEPLRVLTEPSERPPFTFVWRRVSHRVVRAEGPERLSPEWGRERPDARTRDYYRVEDERGRRFWIYREGFFVEDAHGEAGAPAWFMHGLFA